jgi:hypothetical protein
MPAVNPGEVWMTDFGLAAKVRPALVLTSAPTAEELDLVTLDPPHDRDPRQSLGIGYPKTFSQAGCIPPATDSDRFHGPA